MDDEQTQRLTRIERKINFIGGLFISFFCSVILLGGLYGISTYKSQIGGLFVGVLMMVWILATFAAKVYLFTKFDDG